MLRLAADAERQAVALRALASDQASGAPVAEESAEDLYDAMLPRTRISRKQLEQLEADAAAAGYSKVGKYIRARLFGAP
ncbi:MAG: hypothetical protein ACO1SV_21615 [Fimbriimonas sp.]